ncbi:MAG: hypothetical protein IBX48_07675 [Thiomicrospira sp.]|uniref:DUF6789 family protein n=1 Tax=Thiomicrospira sp. TaxID=935 RepID=UPI0019FA8899|nr:DUF6789 family protein [Thiomicrospira sp.]MBE0494207.1 hypothetical protein [Thiomicrospira sp.]
MKVLILKPILAGIIATAVMSVFAMTVPSMMNMPPMDFGVMLGEQNPLMPMPYMMGWVMHFIVGSVLALIYAYIFLKRLPGPRWFRGILFAMLPFIIAQSVMMPMMGNGFWSAGEMSMLIASFMGHVVFGVVLGATCKGV